MEERTPLEKRITEVLSKHNVRPLRLEMSKSFGNVLLIAATPHTQLRFVRDRGYNFCEICKKGDGSHWEDDLLSSSPALNSISDFCDFVDKVLTAKNL